MFSFGTQNPRPKSIARTPRSRPVHDPPPIDFLLMTFRPTAFPPMIFPRRLEPELLDQMAADDPRAIRVRRDLRLVNAFMRNAQCMASTLKKNAAGRQPHTIVDLGSGDGRVMLQVARQLAKF